jgi:hypothetical protein
LNPEKEVGTTKPPKGSKEEGLGESCGRAKECGLICPRILPLSIISIVSLSPISEFGLNETRMMMPMTQIRALLGSIAR